MTTHRVMLARALEPGWLDLALQLSRDDPDRAREQLELRLRDRIPAPEGRKKTVRALWRTWLEPPEPARDMIEWARTRSPCVGDARTLHLGALIATHPFFGDVCAAIGREVAQTKTVRVSAVRQRLRDRWAARESVDVSVRAGVRTLRAFGILSAGERGLTAEHILTLDVPSLLGGWFAHGLLLERGVAEIDAGILTSAPEFFMLSLPTITPDGYSGLEALTEGGRRVVLRATHSVASYDSPGTATASATG